MYLGRISRWSFVVAAFVAVCFIGRPAAAMHVADFGEAGFLNIDYQVQAREAFSNIGSGPTGDDRTNNFYLRRNRLSFLGAVTETYGFALQVEYNGGRKIGDTAVSQQADDYKLLLLDYYLTADYADALKLRAGKTKHMLTREVNEGCFDPLSIDRSAFILGPFSDARPEKTTRDYGVTALGNFHSGLFQYRLGIMQGNKFGDNRPGDMGYRYTGRVHVSLLDPEDNWGYKGSYLGKKKVFTVGAGYEMQQNAVFANHAVNGEKSYKAYTYDVFFEYPTGLGTVTASGAYLKHDFGGAGTNLAAGATGVGGEKNGWYGKAAYMLGKVQVYGRYEKWSFANLGGVAGQKINWTAEGVNYYIKGQNLRLTLEMQNIDFVLPGAKDFRTVLLQFQARI